MKTDTNGINTTIEQKEVMKETKEINTIDARSESEHRSFGVVDLWNVRKRLRTSASMSRWLN